MMKGLLVKDFRLMKGQKNFFFVIVAVTVGMSVFFDASSFLLGFLPFVLSQFTLSTISYDEFDNGNAFLFTLPVSRADYAIEKYCLALLLSGSAWIFATLLAIAFNVLKGGGAVSEIAVAAVMILVAVIVIQAIMIPFQLKFGGEKGRIVLIGVVGLLSVAGIVLVKAAEMLGVDIANILNNLPMVSMGVMVTIILIISVIILLLSLQASVLIMKRKEF